MSAIASVIGHDEFLILVGLVLVAIGMWPVWRPAAYLVPGIVFLWLGLPSRVPFVTRPVATKHEPGA